MHGPSVTNAGRENVVNITSMAEGGGGEEGCNYSRLPLLQIASLNVPSERIILTKECSGSEFKAQRKTFTL